LNQTTSESAGIDDILRISNPSSINNGDYLICGNDNQSVLFSAHAGSNCTISATLARDWKFHHVGDFGTVDLRFDLTGISGFTASELRLLMDLDGDGYDDETPIEGVYVAPYFTAAGVTIPNGAKVTLCTMKTHYYAVIGGLTSGPIWADSPTGTPGFLNATCAGLDLTIKSGSVVNNDWVTLTCNNITVEAGATFNAGALASQNIHVNGDVTINGVWNDDNCTLNMEGAALQTINGTGYLRVQNWNITNAAGVTLNNLGAIVYGNLGITDGGILNTNDKLNLWSDINGTGEIQSLSAGTINGEVNVRRYRPAATAGWVNFSSSLQDATIEEWDATITTSGFPGSDYPAYAFNSVVYYEEFQPGTDEEGYVGVSNSADILVPGRGYMVYLPTGAYTVSARGTITSGNFNLSPTYNNNGTGAGWNMVGNPYPATIDWNAVGWNKVNMNEAVYIWRPNINQYASYVDGVASNGGSNLIAPGQSFFVEANGINPVLMLTEECKSKSPGTFRNAEATMHQLSIRMHMEDWQDETVLISNESATKTFDSAYDAKKLRSPIQQAPYMSTLDENGQNLSINSIRITGEEQIIPIRIEAGISGVYTLEVTGLEAFAKGACVTLEEIFTQTSYVLSEGTTIELPLEAGDHTLRYQLRIGSVSLSNITHAGCSSSQGGSAEVIAPANTTSVVEWLNAAGQMFATTAPVNGVAKVESLVAGNYTARITNNGACGTTSFNFEIAQLNKLGASAVVMPASCENTDDGGISISVSGGEAPYQVEWNNGMEGTTIENAAAGKYVAHIMDSNGCEGNFQFEVESVSALLSKFEVSHEQIELVNGEARVEFTNTSENAESFTWNFGDGEESSLESPTHAYLNAGTYEVMLKATFENCESVSTRTVAVTDNSQAEEFAGDVLATLTDRGVQVTFLFDELKNIRINAYNVLGQQLIEPIVGEYGNQTITFSDRRYAANALIEVTDLNTGEKTLIRLGR
jgi:PKD repeat protein